MEKSFLNYVAFVLIIFAFAFSGVCNMAYVGHCPVAVSAGADVRLVQIEETMKNSSFCVSKFFKVYFFCFISCCV